MIRKTFATFGLPLKLVNSNGPCSQSLKFENFVIQVELKTEFIYHTTHRKQTRNLYKNYENVYLKDTPKRDKIISFHIFVEKSL